MTRRDKGKRFESKIKALLEKAGLEVATTPDSNDFGVDLLTEYDGYKLALQCKYCETGRAIGNQAVQEVVAGRACYAADKCVVVTNGTFTSQAVKQADFNHVLLIDGSMLSDICINEDGDIELFDLMFGPEYKVSLCRARADMLEDTGEVTIADLQERYGVSRWVIMRYLIPAGLPLVKRGTTYVTTWIELRFWEEDMGSITYGKGDKFVLEFGNDYC